MSFYSKFSKITKYVSFYTKFSFFFFFEIIFPKTVILFIFAFLFICSIFKMHNIRINNFCNYYFQKYSIMKFKYYLQS